MTKSFPAAFILKEVIEVINIATIKGNLTSPACRIPIRSFRLGSVTGYTLISHSMKTTFFMYVGDCYTAKVALIFQGKDSGSPSSFGCCGQAGRQYRVKKQFSSFNLKFKKVLYASVNTVEHLLWLVLFIHNNASVILQCVFLI